MNNSTVTDLQRYEPGDWVVHRKHGSGQIESVEKRSVGDKTNTYCKIRTTNITIWLPVGKMNDDWLRPLATPSQIEQALEILKGPPRPMPDNLNGRRNRIKSVDTNDSPSVIAELLRDLWALKKVKKMLSQVEEEALRHFTNCFLAEFSLILNVPIEEAREEFRRTLKIGQTQTTSE